MHTIILGSGPGGYVAAIRLAQLGQQVTVIEEDTLGGTCLNWGCIPSKALINTAGILDQMRHGEILGLMGENLRIDLAKTQQWKSGVVQKLTGGIGQLFKSHGIILVKGHGRLVNGKTVEVSYTDAEPQRITGDAIVIATGSLPVPLPGFETDGERIYDSRELLDLTEVPQRLAVLGGGVIGLEMGQLFATLGSQVTVIEMGPQLLPGTDPDISNLLARLLKKQGITLYLSTKAEAPVKNEDDTLSIALKNDKTEEMIIVDKLLVAVGRKPNTQGLGLETVELAMDAKGFIQVNDQMKTSVEGIYAIGDVCRPPLLAHKASKEGLLVADVIAGKPVHWDVRAMPAAVFTRPEVATVGLSEAQAKQQGTEIRVGKFPFQASGRALTMNESDGFIKMISDAKTDRILGIQMIGPHVSDLLGEATLAIETGCTSEDLALTVHTHPTLPESMMEAAEAVHQMAIHIYQKAGK